MVAFQHKRFLFLQISEPTRPSSSGGAGGGSERTPLISIDICSDEDVRDHQAGPDVLVRHYGDGGDGANLASLGAGGKRHSTGDAAADCAGFQSALLGRQCNLGAPAAAKNSTVSLYEPGAAARKKSGSRTAITDI